MAPVTEKNTYFTSTLIDKYMTISHKKEEKQEKPT